jgi:hypothetical protein
MGAGEDSNTGCVTAKHERVTAVVRHGLQHLFFNIIRECTQLGINGTAVAAHHNSCTAWPHCQYLCMVASAATQTSFLGFVSA